MTYAQEKRFEKTLKRLFSDMWHSTGTIKTANGKCYWCKHKSTTKAYVNIWGTVHITPSCAICKPKNHGILRDDL